MTLVRERIQLDTKASFPCNGKSNTNPVRESVRKPGKPHRRRGDSNDCQEIEQSRPLFKRCLLTDMDRICFRIKSVDRGTE